MVQILFLAAVTLAATVVVLGAPVPHGQTTDVHGGKPEILDYALVRRGKNLSIECPLKDECGDTQMFHSHAAFCQHLTSEHPDKLEHSGHARSQSYPRQCPLKHNCVYSPKFANRALLNQHLVANHPEILPSEITAWLNTEPAKEAGVEQAYSRQCPLKHICHYRPKFSSTRLLNEHLVANHRGIPPNERIVWLTTEPGKAPQFAVPPDAGHAGPSRLATSHGDTHADTYRNQPGIPPNERIVWLNTRPGKAPQLAVPPDASHAGPSRLATSHADDTHADTSRNQLNLNPEKPYILPDLNRSPPPSPGNM